jgi:RsiW-degrading membrane proteinase PrsW (M82 family)
MKLNGNLRKKIINVLFYVGFAFIAREVLFSSLNPLMGNNDLHVVLIAPFWEELCKLLFLLWSTAFGFIYTAVFAGMEFYSYITNPIMSIGTNYHHLLFLRAVVVLFHMFTCTVTYIGVRRWRYSGRKLWIGVFFGIAVCLHILWNTVGGMHLYLLTEDWFPPPMYAPFIK